jgi:hypothetical protein
VSKLGSLSGEAERDQRLLSRLNDAVIALQVDALGKSGEFSLSDEVISQSRKTLADFVERFQAELRQEGSTADLYPLGFKIRTGMKPLKDWQQDLAKLSHQLSEPGAIGLEDLPIFEEILSLLDDEFADDLRQLYAH